MNRRTIRGFIAVYSVAAVLFCAFFVVRSKAARGELGGGVEADVNSLWERMARGRWGVFLLLLLVVAMVWFIIYVFRFRKDLENRDSDDTMHKTLSILSHDFEFVDHILLTEVKTRDVSGLYTPSDLILRMIPDWETTRYFHDRLELLMKYFVLEEDRGMFRASTRRERICRELMGKEHYSFRFRALVDGEIRYYQMKFVGHGGKTGPVDAFTVGMRNVDEEVRDDEARILETERLVERRTIALKKANLALNNITNGVLELMGSLIESRSEESGRHIRHVKGFTKILATKVMEEMPRYGLTEEDVNRITYMSALHDVGKIAIPDGILLKPGKLTGEEFAVIKGHTVKGADIIHSMEEIWTNDYIATAREIALYHHEKWNGEGYPCGLIGDETPIAAQIVSLADVYDALIGERCYKKGYPKEEAYRMIMAGECGSFSDGLLRCFTACKEQFEAFAEDPVEPVEEPGIHVEAEYLDMPANLKPGVYLSDVLPAIEEISSQMPGILLICKGRGRRELLYGNNGLKEVLGCNTDEDFADRKASGLIALVPLKDRKQLNALMDAFIADATRSTLHMEHGILREDGETVRADAVYHVIRSDDLGEIVFGAYRQITELPDGEDPEA